METIQLDNRVYVWDEIDTILWDNWRGVKILGPAVIHMDAKRSIKDKHLWPAGGFSNVRIEVSPDAA